MVHFSQLACFVDVSVHRSVISPVDGHVRTALLFVIHSILFDYEYWAKSLPFRTVVKLESLILEHFFLIFDCRLIGWEIRFRFPGYIAL